MAATTMLAPAVVAYPIQFSQGIIINHTWEGELFVTQHSIQFSSVKVESDVVFLFFAAAIDFVVVDDVEVPWAAGNLNVINAQVV